MPPTFLYGLIGYCVKEPDNVNTIALEDVSASITVRGFVAHIKSSLRYRNATALPLQVTFKTPVDEGSALYHVEAKLEDRVIVAKCLEKNKAEKVYKDAVEAGQTAVLVREESETADIINLALGNLPAGAECEVTLSLVAELRVGSDGGVQFTLPTVLNPRYQPASSTGPDAPVVSHVTPVATASKPYSIQVAASVCGALDIARIISHSDPINVVMEDDNKSAKISQDGGYRSDHEWSFVVHYNNPYSPQVLIETGDPTATGLMKDQVLMLNLFPELPSSSYSRFNEVIFVIDRSVSMAGVRIKCARAAFLLFLKNLPHGCRFNVVSFGAHFSFLFEEGSRVYSEETLAEACALHDKMDADLGGTEILQPLKAIYSQPVHPEYPRQILLLTGCAASNTDELTTLAALHAPTTRVFAVGVGVSASSALVGGLARAGRGRAEIITRRAQMLPKVMGLLTSILQSSVCGVDVSCELDPPSRLSLVPPEPPVIFAGQHLVTFARMPPGTQLKGVTLTGQVDGQEWRSSVAGAHLRTVHDANFALHRLAAKASILHLERQRGLAKAEMLQLSEEAGVTCPHTGFVAAHQDPQLSQRHITRPNPFHFTRSPHKDRKATEHSSKNGYQSPKFPSSESGLYENASGRAESSQKITSPKASKSPFTFAPHSSKSQDISKPSFTLETLPTSNQDTSKLPSTFGSPLTKNQAASKSSFSLGPRLVRNRNVGKRSSPSGTLPTKNQNISKPNLTFSSLQIKDQNVSKPSFTFEAQPTLNQNTSKLSFTFGSPTTENQNASKPSFTFGPPPSKNQAISKSSFSFGAQTIKKKNTWKRSSSSGILPKKNQNASKPYLTFSSLQIKDQNISKPSLTFGPPPTKNQNMSNPFRCRSPPTKNQDTSKLSLSFESQPAKNQSTFKPPFAFKSQSTTNQTLSKFSFTFGSQQSMTENVVDPVFSFGVQPNQKSENTKNLPSASA